MEVLKAEMQSLCVLITKDFKCFHTHTQRNRLSEKERRESILFEPLCVHTCTWNIRLLASTITKWEREANRAILSRGGAMSQPSHSRHKRAPMAPEGESHGCHPRKPPALMQACHLLSIWDRNEELSLKSHLSLFFNSPTEKSLLLLQYCGSKNRKPHRW